MGAIIGRTAIAGTQSYLTAAVAVCTLRDNPTERLLRAASREAAPVVVSMRSLAAVVA